MNENTCPARHARNPHEERATGRIGYQIRADFRPIPLDAETVDHDAVGVHWTDPWPVLYTGLPWPHRWRRPSTCED